ncbi:hypothetical protein K443DRAFT_7619 [Laccaria amethystina LaAM-08-1]|uniref:Uncharacterized protein n=1 Tax=Laccaria amethystina LaAM-08-1 TaxID=1095629 RepID=A0A0C9XXA1_9AGAR|nr:hypothetical protein K443DRAFT_7619 [Laccaria amethystina LaAM-08-1]
MSHVTTLCLQPPSRIPQSCPSSSTPALFPAGPASRTPISTDKMGMTLATPTQLTDQHPPNPEHHSHEEWCPKPGTTLSIMQWWEMEAPMPISVGLQPLFATVIISFA